MAASIMNARSWKVGMLLGKRRVNIHLCVRLLLLVAAEAAITTVATQVMFAFHMLFVNILLLNLLIALFRYLRKIEKQIKKGT